MKNNVLKYYIAVFYFCSTFVMFAQPGTEDSSNALEGTDPPPAPIDDYLLILAAIGLVYVFLRLRAFSQQKTLKINN